MTLHVYYLEVKIYAICFVILIFNYMKFIDYSQHDANKNHHQRQFYVYINSNILLKTQSHCSILSMNSRMMSIAGSFVQSSYPLT